MDSICATAVDSLVRIWTILHADLPVQFDKAEARFLREAILGMEDDLVARLLARKLAISSQPKAGDDRDLAKRGSELAYLVDGRRQCATLVHGSGNSLGLMSVGSRYGAAVVGLRPGQSILWPTECGRLTEIRVLTVDARAGPGPHSPIHAGCASMRSCASAPP